MHNAQLGSKERTCVYVELDTKRILGFAPEFVQAVIPAGIRYTEYTLVSAREIERWVGRYREQQQRDAEEASYRQLMREKGFRDALKSSIRARNSQVNLFNRELNNVLIRLMDERYEAMLKAKAKPEVFGAAEAWEAGKDGEDVALENPLLRLRPENA
jgi:hypothetical protein